MTAVRVNELRVSLGGRDVIRSMSCAFAAGELTGLIGPNGAGKTSLLRAVAGVLPYDGQIRVGSEERRDLGRDSASLQIAYLGQDRDVSWPLTVRSVVGLGRQPHLRPFQRLARTDRTAIDDAIARLDLDGLAEKPVTELSGGERARVLIARALAQETDVLLLDEPTAGLDPRHQIALMTTFRHLAREGRTVVVSLHDLDLAARWCDRTILLADGQCVAEGDPANVLTRRRIADVYGVDADISDENGRIGVRLTGLAHVRRAR